MQMNLLSQVQMKRWVRSRSPPNISGVLTAKEHCSRLLNNWMRWGLFQMWKKTKNKNRSELAPYSLDNVTQDKDIFLGKLFL